MTLTEFLRDRTGKYSRRMTLFRSLVEANPAVAHPKTLLQWNVLWGIVQGLYDLILTCPRLPNTLKDPDPSHRGQMLEKRPQKPPKTPVN